MKKSSGTNNFIEYYYGNDYLFEKSIANEFNDLLDYDYLKDIVNQNYNEYLTKYL
jgi:hypothetical protein